MSCMKLKSLAAFMAACWAERYLEKALRRRSLVDEMTDELFDFLHEMKDELSDSLHEMKDEDEPLECEEDIPAQADPREGRHSAQQSYGRSSCSIERHDISPVPYSGTAST